MAHKIVILPESISNRIAAGEIIERPASIVRELLDNAIDAGATRIETDIEQGGGTLIRVVDNGHGFDPDGLLLAFERHATSKIRNLEDLDAIRTLGFRGEALPSIASVSRVTVESFCPEFPSGARLQINGGKVDFFEPAVCPAGTRMTVRNVFFNTPARRKFMKTPKTEYAQVFETVIDHAMTYPSICFLLRNEGRSVLDTPAVDHWSARVSAIFGKKFLEQHVFIRGAHPDLHIQGFICHPEYLRSTGRAQRIYVNGRRVRDRFVTQAMYRGYSQFITGGGHPSCILRIDVPPELVDVNVHPAKTEVRFGDSHTIFNLVSSLISQSLAGSMKQQFTFHPAAPASSGMHSPAVSPDYRGQSRHTVPPASIHDAVPQTGDPCDAYEPALKSEAEQLVHQPFLLNVDKWHLVGQAFNTFILLENGDHIIVIDQHTAHERILFEKFKKQYQAGNIPSQTLLFPVPVELEMIQFQVIREYSELLRTMGLIIDEFGKNTFAVLALPDHIAQETPDLLLRNLADELLEVEATERTRIAERKMLVSLACRKAVKAGDVLTPMEMRSLINEMAENEIPNSCPHGRPIVVTMHRDEFSRRFKR